MPFKVLLVSCSAVALVLPTVVWAETDTGSSRDQKRPSIQRNSVDDSHYDRFRAQRSRRIRLQRYRPKRTRARSSKLRVRQRVENLRRGHVTTNSGTIRKNQRGHRRTFRARTGVFSRGDALRETVLRQGQIRQRIQRERGY